MVVPVKPLAFVFTFARKYTLALVVTVISMLLLVGAQLVIPWIIRLLINAISGPALSADGAPHVSSTIR